MAESPFIPLLLVFTLFLLAGPAAGASVGFDQPAKTVLAGEVTTLNLTLDSAPDGFSGYRVIISIADPTRGEVAAVALPGWAEVSEITGTPGPDARVMAVDLGSKVERGATGVLLATVSVKGLSPGTTEILLSDPVFTNEDGFDINPVIADASLTVTTGASPGTTEPGATPPTTTPTTATTGPGEESRSLTPTAGSSGQTGGAGGSGSSSSTYTASATPVTPGNGNTGTTNDTREGPGTLATTGPTVVGMTADIPPTTSSEPVQPISSSQGIPVLSAPAILVFAVALILLGRKMN
jgi:hypothetical protein